MKKNIAHSSLFILVSLMTYLVLFFVYGDIILKDVRYAGEEISENNYKKIEKLIVNNNKKVFKRLYIKGKSLEYLPSISQKLKDNNMPLDLQYIPIVESSLNSNAISSSNSDFIGLWQLPSKIAQQYGVEISEETDERYDVDISTSVALEHLNYLYNVYGSWIGATVAYNIGQNEMNIQRRGSSSIDYMDEDLQEKSGNYILKALAYKYGK